MEEHNNRDIVKLLVRNACRPVKASPDFKDSLFRMTFQGDQAEVPGCVRIFGLSSSTWVALASVIAIALIVYGILSVPDQPALIKGVPLSLGLTF